MCLDTSLLFNKVGSIIFSNYPVSVCVCVCVCVRARALHLYGVAPSPAVTTADITEHRGPSIGTNGLLPRLRLLLLLILPRTAAGFCSRR